MIKFKSYLDQRAIWIDFKGDKKNEQFNKKKIFLTNIKYKI